MLFRKKKKNKPIKLLRELKIDHSSGILRQLLQEGDEREMKLKAIAGRPEINTILGENGKGPDDIEDIFWRLMASGTGEDIAGAVIETPKLLTLYLKMKNAKISDLEIAQKFIDIANN